MTDITRYIEKKAKGLAELVALNNAYVISFSKFDPETGEAQSPEVQAVSREELEAEKTKIQAQIADIDAVLLEMDGLGT